MPILLVLFVLGSVFYFVPSLFFDGPVRADISLKPDDQDLVDLGKLVYKNNCASCHGVNLEGQERWRVPDANGYMPAPPHDETGHTWHHPDQMLFEFTKYGPQKFAGSDYKSIMPAYDGKLNDEEIWNVLAYIKSKWPKEIQKKHTEVFGQ